ncbi:MAG TPA: LuxR C-terminal-related transcriptional regulator [Actinomycetes bacterium]|jgi:LuxR family maltose regulon positive regulatory protein|nr:LuxR C-terminal-related transcriptional regulator [Actinomycetes bacterium]
MLARHYRGVGTSRAEGSSIRRARLESRLDRVLEVGAGLVAAGPGYGKTTLLSCWVERLRPSVDVAWVTLAREHADPTILAQHLMAAVRTCRPDYAAPGLRESVMGLGGLAQGSDRRFILVLDDAQVVERSPLFTHLGELLKKTAEGLSVVVSGRSAPPGPWALLRARQRLIEIDAKDLTFTDQETAALLEQAFGVKLPSSSVAELQGWAEGWVAALVMAGLALREADDPVRVLETGLARHRHVRAFLEEEVIRSLPLDLVEFLERTSILDRMDPRLCNVLAERDDSLAVLRQLTARSLFTREISLDPPLYAYHPLLIDRLRLLLEETGPEVRVRLLRTASRWYEAHDQPGPAIELALNAGDVRRAMTLIRAASGTAIRHGYAATVVRWIRMLPEEAVRTNLELSIILGRAAGLIGQTDIMAATLRAVSGVIADAPDQATPGIRPALAYLNAAMDLFEGRLGALTESFGSAYELLLKAQTNDPLLEMIEIDTETVQANLGTANLLAGRFDRAVELAEGVLDPVHLLHPTRLTILALGVRALAYAWAGDRPNAAAALRAGLQVLRSFEGPATDRIALHLAAVWLDQDDADANLASADAIARSAGFSFLLALVALAEARLWAHRGAPELAGHALDRADEVIAALPDPATLPSIAARLRAGIDDLATHGVSGNLNEREIEVLAAIADGATRGEAARRLYLSTNTVKTHLRSAYRKLGANDRDTAIARARALGLIGSARG